MSCDKCKETSCILQSNIKIDGNHLYVDLRLDMDNNEMDIEVVLHNHNEWTGAVSINYCPFCGEKLPELKES